MTEAQHTQQAAQALARQRAAMPRRRSSTVTVSVDVDVDLSEIETDDLIEELELRDAPIDHPQWDRLELEALHNLFMVGREAEAVEGCRRLLRDVLGRAI